MKSPIEQKAPSTVVKLPTTLLPPLAAFLAVAEAGSFTAAARRTSTDKTVMSRRVKALETALGVRLLNRTTRSVHLTPAGQRLVDEAQEPVSDALAALARTRAPDHLAGVVRVASAHSLAQGVTVPALIQVQRQHPQLRIELSAYDGMTPLVERGYELGLRVGRMPDSSLICRKLATWRYVLVASPQWVADHPEVKSPADLPGHWIQWGKTARTQTWGFARGDEGLDLRMDRFPLVFDSSYLMVECAKAGMGMTALPPFTAAAALAEGSLVRLLPEWRVVHELGIFGVTPHRTMVPARVLAVLEAVRTRLAEVAPQWAAMTA